MIKQVSIQNFKSILDLTFQAKRVNIFIGEPNSGKSNLLEALSLFAIANVSNLSSLMRYEEIPNLFYDNNIQDQIRVKVDDRQVDLTGKKNNIELIFSRINEKYTFKLYQHSTNDWSIHSNVITKKENEEMYEFNPDLLVLDEWFEDFKPYHFSVYHPNLKETPYYHLSSPFGDNLFEVIQTNKQLREIIAGIFLDKGYKLNLNASRREINFIKEQDNVLYTYPYQLLSDTLQRTIFYTAVLESNRDSIILLEEPEAKMFPYFTNQLAESIALDSYNNQFFIVTHNPYFLSSIIGKTPIDSISVNVVYSEDYQTKTKQLSEDELSEALDLSSGIFFNLDQFLPE